MANRHTRGRGPAISLKESAAIMARIFRLMFRFYPGLVILTALFVILSASAGVVGSVFTGTVVVGHYVYEMLGLTSNLVSTGSPLVHFLLPR